MTDTALPVMTINDIVGAIFASMMEHEDKELEESKVRWNVKAFKDGKLVESRESLTHQEVLDYANGGERFEPFSDESLRPLWEKFINSDDNYDIALHGLLFQMLVQCDHIHNDRYELKRVME